MGTAMNHAVSQFHRHTRLAICACFLLAVLQVGASDSASSRTSNGGEHTSSSSTPATASEQNKTEKTAKYDVDRIGQRDIGKGANLYSLEKERSIGQAMAAAMDVHTRFVTDPDINDYISRLGQKIARNSDAQVPFTIKVIDSPDFRTFALPGGCLYVDKGLILEVDSEAELAGLMAHEIAHVAARHATRYASQ